MLGVPAFSATVLSGRQSLARRTGLPLWLPDSVLAAAPVIFNPAASRYRRADQSAIVTDPTLLTGFSHTRTGEARAATLAGAVTEPFPTNVLARSDRGAPVEEQRTNLLLNSVLAGGGSAPTSWSLGFGTGTSTPVASNVRNTAYRQAGTAQRAYLFQSVSLAANTTYVCSFYVEAVTLAPSGTFAYATSLPTGASSTTIITPTVGRNTFTITMGATAGTVQIRIGLGAAGNDTADVTWSNPQLEAGAFATSLIDTTTAAATRGLPRPAVTGLTLPTNFVLFADVDLYAQDGVLRQIANVNDGTNNNVLQLARTSGNAASILWNLGGAAQPALGSFSGKTGARRLKVAARVRGTTVKGFCDGAAAADAVWTVPAGLGRLDVGATAGGSGPMNGYAGAVLILPDMSDADLLRLTT